MRSVELFIAWRYLKARRRGFYTLLTTLIAVNTTDGPQHCRFRFASRAGSQAEVMFEQRHVPCGDGLQDSFGGLARHVYAFR